MKFRHLLTRPVRSCMRMAGYDVIRTADLDKIMATPHQDFSDQDRADVDAVSPYTMVPPERLYTLARAVEYVVKNQIPGDLVECGTWKGGCAMTMLRTLIREGITDREGYFYDLFGGDWPAPTNWDRTQGVAETERMQQITDEERTMMEYTLDEVRANLGTTGYPDECIHLIPGDVKNTIPVQAPKQIALLRLDTDYYESTYHELEHLYPRLSSGGVLIIDDYGDWEGSRKATDDYIAREGLPLLLVRVDVGARMAVKP